MRHRRGVIVVSKEFIYFIFVFKSTINIFSEFFIDFLVKITIISFDFSSRILKFLVVNTNVVYQFSVVYIINLIVIS